ncbi:TolC family protein [Chitinophaga sp.]|uniref:TolC family protein n=1 Tax=Chitinophaga sp. TaxID=1869181 RepID=UPI0031E30F70
MNRDLFTYTLLLIVFLLPVPGKSRAQHFSKDSLTLEQVWNVVDAGNSQLKLSSLAFNESIINVDISRDNLLPSLAISGSALHNTKFRIYPDGLFSSPDFFPVSKYGYGFGYSFSLNIYEGGKNSRNIRISEEEKLKMQNEYGLQRNNVHYLAAVVFYDLYKFLHFRDFLSIEIATQKKQLQTIESFYKNGTVLESDVLRSRVKLSQLELSLSQLNKQIQIASQRLNILMGHGSEDSVVISYEDSIKQSEPDQHNSYQEYVDISLAQSPAYKIEINKLKLANLGIRQVRSNILPTVSLFSYYNYTYPQVSYYPYSNQLWSFGQMGVKMTYSLENLYKNKHLLARAKNVIARQTEMVKMKQDELSADIKEAYLQYQQAAEEFKTAEENIKQNTESVRVIRNSYVNQESLLTDLLNAENSLLESKFALTAATVNIRLSYIRLLAKTGIL